MSCLTRVARDASALSSPSIMLLRVSSATRPVSASCTGLCPSDCASRMSSAASPCSRSNEPPGARKSSPAEGDSSGGCSCLRRLRRSRTNQPARQAKNAQAGRPRPVAPTANGTPLRTTHSNGELLCAVLADGFFPACFKEGFLSAAISFSTDEKRLPSFASPSMIVASLDDGSDSGGCLD